MCVGINLGDKKCLAKVHLVYGVACVFRRLLIVASLQCLDWLFRTF